MTFGEKFKAEREKRKLTQQEVADALGINRRMITRYENGISFPRTKDAYRKIAEYFKAVSYTHLDVYKRQGLDRVQVFGYGNVCHIGLPPMS